jgi:hypothetical protein
MGLVKAARIKRGARVSFTRDGASKHDIGHVRSPKLPD